MALQNQNPFAPWWEPYRIPQQSPAYDITHAAWDLLGRAPDPEGLVGHMPGHAAHGAASVRRSILASPEYQSRLLGGMPQSASQDAGRRATAGINAMPGVFSDYTSHQIPGSHYDRLDQYKAAQQMYPDAFQALLGAFAPTPEPEIPSAIQQLLSGPAIPEPEPQPKKKKDEEREGNFWGTNPMDHTR